MVTTGWATRLPRWLGERGYTPAPETRVGINLGYATGRFRVPAHLLPDHPILYIVGCPPHETKFGSVVRAENGMVNGAVGGYHGDHPPADLPGFLRFARGLSQPHVFEILSQAELVSPLARYGISTSLRRHYSKLARFPHGLLPFADALCSFDPAFAQGMSVAAMEAEILADCLARSPRTDELFRREYLWRVDLLVDVPWDLATGENWKYPQIAGRRPFLFPLVKRYRDRLATCGDAYVTAEFYRVLTLSAWPTVLLRPRVVARAFTTNNLSSSLYLNF